MSFYVELKGSNIWGIFPLNSTDREGDIEVMFLCGYFHSFPTAFSNWYMLIWDPVSHPENLQGITMKVQVSSAFSSFHGYTGDKRISCGCLPQFFSAPSPGARSAQFFVHSTFKVLYLAYKYAIARDESCCASCPLVQNLAHDSRVFFKLLRIERLQNSGCPPCQTKINPS